MATLAGKITDVTSSPPDSISSITVKAPSVRIGGGTDVIVSSPATVDFNRDTGDITISGLTGGLSWLHIEGDGWADSIPLAVAEGMIALVEAIANAAGAPGIADYISLLAGLESRVGDIAQDAVDTAAQDIMWPKGAVSDADSLRAPGAYRATTATVGLPDGAKNKAGIFEVLPAGASLVTQRFTATGVTQETWERTARDSTSWYSWNRVIPVVQEVIGHVDNVGPGEYFTGFSTEGLPADATTIHGSFEVLQSRTQRTQRFTTWGLNPEVWLRSRQTDTNWYPWKLQPKAEVVDSLANRLDAVESFGGSSSPSQGMKIVPLALTVGDGDSAGSPGSATYRIIGHWGATVTRWRLCMTTRNPRYDMNANNATVNRITVAQHAGNGATTGVNTRVVTSDITVPGDGSVWRSGWHNRELTANVEYAFGVQYTGGNAPQLSGHSFLLPTGTNPDSQSVTGSRRTHAPFDVWIEAETYASTQVVAGIGDSTTVGAGATRELVDSWLGLYARKIGALPVHYAASGDSAYNWGRKLDGYQMTRWSHLSQPDAVVFALGNNDMNTTTDGLTMAERVEGLIPYIRKYIGSNLYAATVKPRASLTSDEIASRNAYTAWLTTTGKQYFRDVFDFHTPVASGDLLDSQYDSGDGTHLNDLGYQQLSGAVGTVTDLRMTKLVEAAGVISHTVSLVSGIGGTITLRKNGRVVTVEIDKVSGASGSINAGTLPSGFRPLGTLYIYAFESTNVDLDGARVGVTGGGNVTLVGADSSLSYYGTGVYMARE